MIEKKCESDRKEIKESMFILLFIFVYIFVTIIFHMRVASCKAQMDSVSKFK